MESLDGPLVGNLTEVHRVQLEMETKYHFCVSTSLYAQSLQHNIFKTSYQLQVLLTWFIL